MDRYTRWSNLLDLLANRERLTVEEAARDLGVSEATVRRDFEALAAQRKLLRLRGVAVHAASPVAHPLLSGDAGAPAGSPELRRVAAQATRLLRPGTVVGLTGTVATRALSRAIGLRLDSQAQHGNPHPSSGLLTVVTNDLVAATELARRPGAKVVVSGGVLDGSAHVLGGPLAGLLLQGISLDTALVAPDAVDPEFGATAADEVDAGIAAAMVARARQVVVAAVSSDLDRSAFARVCETGRIDVLVTDDGIAPSTADRFRNRGVRVVLS